MIRNWLLSVCVCNTLEKNLKVIVSHSRNIGSCATNNHIGFNPYDEYATGHYQDDFLSGMGMGREEREEWKRNVGYRKKEVVTSYITIQFAKMVNSLSQICDMFSTSFCFTVIQLIITLKCMHYCNFV